MGYAIEDIEGIGPVFGEKLKAANINTPEALLEQCASKPGRAKAAQETGIDEGKILKFVNHADLMRISGIGPQIAELMEAAGVDTVKELRNRNAANLAEKMEEINAEKNLTKANIGENQVQGWVDQAKEIEPKVTH